MLIAGSVAGECRLNRASQQWMIGQDPWGNGRGGGRLGVVTLHNTQPVKNRGERTVCGKTGEEPELKERDWESGRLRA